MTCATPLHLIAQVGNCPQCGLNVGEHILRNGVPTDPAIKSLLIEADSFISHMFHRGSWPGDRYEVDRLIGRLRKASQ